MGIEGRRGGLHEFVAQDTKVITAQLFSASLPLGILGYC